MRIKVLSLVPVLVALAVAPALASDCSATKAKVASSTIVETAVSAGSFNTLVAAVKAAGLVETLQSDGPFTVFAPTDDAFAKLPAGALDALLADPEKLKQILLYHVVPGKVTASQVVTLDRATTAQGSDVAIKLTGGKVMVNDATVIQADVETSNGVIHVVDTVIFPST